MFHSCSLQILFVKGRRCSSGNWDSSQVIWTNLQSSSGGGVSWGFNWVSCPQPCNLSQDWKHIYSCSLSPATPNLSISTCALLQLHQHVSLIFLNKNNLIFKYFREIENICILFFFSVASHFDWMKCYQTWSTSLNHKINYITGQLIFRSSKLRNYKGHFFCLGILSRINKSEKNSLRMTEYISIIKGPNYWLPSSHIDLFNFQKKI
jgi:hypothetical protein